MRENKDFEEIWNETMEKKSEKYKHAGYGMTGLMNDTIFDEALNLYNEIIGNEVPEPKIEMQINIPDNLYSSEPLARRKSNAFSTEDISKLKSMFKGKSLDHFSFDEAGDFPTISEAYAATQPTVKYGNNLGSNVSPDNIIVTGTTGTANIQSATLENGVTYSWVHMPLYDDPLPITRSETRDDINELRDLQHQLGL